MPTLGLTAVAVYALCAILVTSGSLIVQASRLRRYLYRDPADSEPGDLGWAEAIQASKLRQLVPPLAVAPLLMPADGTAVLQNRFEPEKARREVARLFYVGAARAHFFSALIVLAAGVVLGAAQQRGPLPLIPGPVPTVPTALAIAGLVLVAFLARIAVDVAAEPVIETISRLPTEPPEAGLLRRAIELMEAMQTAGPVTTLQIPGQLAASLEQGQLALLDAIERLSTTTNGLATTTISSIDAVEAAFRTIEARQQASLQRAGMDTAAMAELRQALSGLTAALERGRGRTDTIAETAARSDPDTSRRQREPGLAQELRKLLQEIETAS
jgi:hypothetical protein